MKGKGKKGVGKKGKGKGRASKGSADEDAPPPPQAARYVVCFSLYEIYCEKIRDLLQDKPADETA